MFQCMILRSFLFIAAIGLAFPAAARDEGEQLGDAEGRPGGPETEDSVGPTRAAEEEAEVDEQKAATSYEASVRGMTLKELLAVPLDYGYENAQVSTHLYLVTALWSLQDQAFGSFADQGSSLAGYPNFVTYSGYIDIRGRISETLFAEAEFELYKGQTGETKVNRLRGVWRPVPYFQLALGRDFPPIGVQDYVYYPTSQLRLFAHAPYLYTSILRATGWWDTGIHASGYIPLPFLGEEAKLKLAVSVINGPGDSHRDENFLIENMRPNAAGYMYEAFHSKARQPWDNNAYKPIPFRVSFSPIEGLDIGGSAMFSKYRDNEKKWANYLFAHLLYAGERLTVAAEYGQLAVGVDPDNMMNAVNLQNETFGDRMVTQRSWYASAGYRVIYKRWKLEYIEPVVRYELMDSWVEDTTSLGDRHLIWAGLRAAPMQGWIIKAAYMFQWEPEGPELDNDGYIIESVFHF